MSQVDPTGAGPDPLSLSYPVPTSEPEYRLLPQPKTVSKGRIYSLLDSLFAGLGLILTFWYLLDLLTSGVNWSWQSIVYLVIFWLIFTYLALPRMHQLFTTLYLPDYFIARSKTGDGLLGDPVNFALIGEDSDIHAVMRQAGWTQADPITLKSSLGIILSTVTRRSYKAAPVSNLYLFGRRHDFAYQQEVAGSAKQRHHVRFWKVPQGWELPGGKKVDWLAAGTFDRTVGFSTMTLQITHKIDAHIDAERDYIIESARYYDPECSVDVIRDYSPPFHDRNGGGDTVITDGNMPILDVRGARERAVERGAELHQLGDNPLKINSKALSHEMPPGVLWLVGVLIAIEVLLTVFIGVSFGIGAYTGITVLTTEQLAALIGLAIAVLVHVVLFILTLRRHRWARLLLLVFLTLTTIGQLSTITLATGVPNMTAYLEAALSVLQVLALSAPAVREWVFGIRRRSGLSQGH